MRAVNLLLVLLLMLMLMGTSTLAAEPKGAGRHDWPRFLGPRVNGVSDETGWTTKWEGDLKVLWRAEVGIGFANVAVSNGRLYTLGHEPAAGDDKEARGTDRVFCLDAQTGKIVWKHEYPCQRVANLHDGGPAATPTVDGKVVYTLSREGHLFCLRADDGQVVWKRNISEDLAVAMPDWGFCSSPLVHGEMVIVDGGRIAAYDRRNGEPIWKTEAFKPGYGSAAPLRVGGVDAIAVLNNEFLVAVRAADGSEIARQKWETTYATNSTTPLVDKDLVFISTGYRRGCALLRLADDKFEKLYENKNMCNHFSNCVVKDGYLYGIDGNTHDRRNAKLSCLDFQTGELKWEERGFGVGSLMLAGETLIVLSDDGELLTVRPTPDGFEKLARAPLLPKLCWTSPVLANGLLYARDAAGNLACVDLRP